MMLLLLFDVLAYDRVAARYALAELERIVASMLRGTNRHGSKMEASRSQEAAAYEHDKRFKVCST